MSQIIKTVNWVKDYNESITDCINNWRQEMIDCIHDGTPFKEIQEKLWKEIYPKLLEEFEPKQSKTIGLSHPLYHYCATHIRSLYDKVTKEHTNATQTHAINIDVDRKEDEPSAPFDTDPDLFVCCQPLIYRPSFSSGIYGIYQPSYATNRNNNNAGCYMDTFRQMLIHCKPLKRITRILRDYKTSKGITSIEMNDEYQHQQLFNDLCHIILIHIEADNDKLRKHKMRTHKLYECRTYVAQYENISKKIWKYLQTECGECDIDKCGAFERHYSPKKRDIAGCHRVQRCTSTGSVEDITFEQCLDTIHTIFFHSTIKFGIRSCQTTTEDETWMDQWNILAVGELNNIRMRRLRSLGNEETIDDKWWKDVDSKNIESEEDDLDFDSKEAQQKDNKIYCKLITNMGVFRWQNPHGFATGSNQEISHYKPKYKDIKEEVLNNEYYPLSPDRWNQTLRKAAIFCKSWSIRRITTKTSGFYHDQVTEQKLEWSKNERATEKEIVILKLYTDFGDLQLELKKCFRFENLYDILSKIHVYKHDLDEEDYNKRYKQNRELLKNKLESFYVWRFRLLATLHKFGTRLADKNMVFYHGINAKMLIKPTQTLAFSGPLSTTRSYHVARSFATDAGMVLTIASQFPKLRYCNAFDVSLISDFPEEQEWLIGFMYVRLLKVRARKIVDDPNTYDEITANEPLSAIARSIFFAMQLFQQQIFSADANLERIQAQFLKVNRYECCREQDCERYIAQHKYYEDWNMNAICAPLCNLAHKKVKKSKLEFNLNHDKITTEHELDINRMKRMIGVFWRTFQESIQNVKRVKFDVISHHLKRFFMEKHAQKELNIKTNRVKLVISLKEIMTVYPNVEEIHFINLYKLTNEILMQLIQMKRNNSQNTIKKIVFLYFDYQSDPNDTQNMPVNKNIFQNPDDLNNDLVQQFKKLKWDIKHHKNGRSGYIIRLFCA